MCVFEKEEGAAQSVFRCIETCKFRDNEVLGLVSRGGDYNLLRFSDLVVISVGRFMTTYYEAMNHRLPTVRPLTYVSVDLACYILSIRLVMLSETFVSTLR